MLQNTDTLFKESTLVSPSIGPRTKIIRKFLPRDGFETMNDSKSTAESSPRNHNTYNCSYVPTDFSWSNNDIVSPIATYAVTSLACPFTIALNTLIIVVVATKKTLQTNTNILLSSMAAADLLVGVVVQPLAIVSGAFFFRGYGESGIHCTLDVINLLFLCGGFTCSIFHLTAIAWQRQARISLDLINNAASISRRHIKMLIIASWVTALICTIPAVMITTGEKLVYITYLFTSAFALIVICWILMAYYYISIYMKTRQITIEPANQAITQTAKAKMEKGIARTTGLLTLTVFLFYTPTFLFPLCYVYPIFCESSYMLWAMTLVQLNSLANPILYCYRNRQLRKATLELLGIETWVMPFAVPLIGMRNRLQPNNMPLQEIQKPALLQGLRVRERSKSWSPNNFNNVRLAAQRRQSTEF